MSENNPQIKSEQVERIKPNEKELDIILHIVKTNEIIASGLARSYRYVSLTRYPTGDEVNDG